MKINKTGLCLAIAAALGTTNAYAVVATGQILGVRIVAGTNPVSTVSPAVYFAKERTLETSGLFPNASNSAGTGAATGVMTVGGADKFAVNGISGGDLNVTFPTNPNYVVNATNTMFVKFNLLKGAKFGTGASPRLLCWGSAGTTPLHKTAVSANLQVNSTSAVSFALPQNFRTTSDAGICTLVVSSYVGVPSSGLAVSANVVYKDGVLTKSASYKGTVISFATGTQFKVLTAGSAVTADVGAESKKFTIKTKVGSATNTVNSAQKTAYLGFVQYGQAAAIKTPGVYRVASGGTTFAAYKTASVSIPLNSASLVFEGAALAAASKLYLVDKSVAGCTGVAGKQLYTQVGNGTSTITFANFGKVAADYNNLSAGMSVCMEVDGTKSIEQSSITVSMGSVVGKTNYKPITTPLNGLNSLATVGQNGTTVRLLNVLPPVHTEKSYIRLYNTSNQPVKVTGSLFTTDGKQVGTTQVIDAALPGLAVKVLDAAALKTLYGDWTGKAMLRLDANSSSFKAVGTIRDATGTLINASGSTKN